MNTSKSACKAKNPEFCRFHSSNSGANDARIEKLYNNYLQEFENSSNVADRYYVEEQLRELEVEYAATDAGREHFATLLDNATDPVEREELNRKITEGDRLREYIEDKADGVSRFPASKLEEAEKRIAAANRKLERAGVEERFTYTTEEYIERDKDGNAYQMIALSISHPTLQVNGWNFVAAVDKAEDGSLITRTLKGQELDGYRPDQYKCDHCGANRRRNSTYLLRNEDGEFKQVGSNCLQSFLGVKPRALWALDYDPEGNGDYFDKGHRTYGSSDTLIPTHEVVAAALAVSDGGEKYVSKGYAYETGKISTVSDMKDYFFSAKRERWSGVNHHEYESQAKELINSTQFEGEGDYVTNMRTLMNQEYTSVKHLGYVASVIAANRRQAAQAKPAKPKAVGYLGQVKDKVSNLNLKITHKFVDTSYYNGAEVTTTTLIMEDSLGRQVKWKASGYKEWSTGDEIAVSTAAIKGLEQYRGNEQTIITRAKATLFKAKEEDEDN